MYEFCFWFEKLLRRRGSVWECLNHPWIYSRGPQVWFCLLLLYVNVSHQYPCWHLSMMLLKIMTMIWFDGNICWWYLPMTLADDICRWHLLMIFADDICWWCELIVRVPPGPENEAGRPNSYGQPQVIDDQYDDYDHYNHSS